MQMVTVHGRTRCQFYQGTADWAAIRAVKRGGVDPGDRQWRCRGLDDIAPMLRAVRRRRRHDRPRRLRPAVVARPGRALRRDRQRRARRAGALADWSPCGTTRRCSSTTARSSASASRASISAGTWSRRRPATRALRRADAHRRPVRPTYCHASGGLVRRRPGTEGGMNDAGEHVPARGACGSCAARRAAASGHAGRRRRPHRRGQHARPRPSSRRPPTCCARHPLAYFVPFGSPLLALVEQVRERSAPVNEYRVDIGTPRNGGERIVDIYAAPSPDSRAASSSCFRSARWPTRSTASSPIAAPRASVTGLAAMLAHEIKNPLSGIRGAAQLLESSVEDDDRALTRLICDEADRIVKLVDRMEVFSDERPLEREPVNIHVVLDHVRRLARSGFARSIRISDEYDPSLPPVYANRDQLVQVFLNLVKNAAEGDRRCARRRDRADHRLPARLSACRCPATEQGDAAAGILRARQRSRRAAKRYRRTCSIRSSPPRPTAPASAWRWSPRSSATTAASSNASRSRGARSSAC